MAKALVILSGGQDSTTCLFWAKQHYDDVAAVTFHYHQRHHREIDAAIKVAEMAGVSEHFVMELPRLHGDSPLTNREHDVEHYDKPEDMPGGVDPTAVPGRNLIFLALAANVAAAHGCHHIVIGVSQEDFGGYPDCRSDFIQAMERAMRLALQDLVGGLNVHAPLMFLNKAATVRVARDLPGCMEALAYTHTCYDGEYPPNPLNHASMLRARGFAEAGLPDPLILRAKAEGLLPEDYPDDGYFGSEE